MEGKGETLFWISLNFVSVVGINFVNKKLFSTYNMSQLGKFDLHKQKIESNFFYLNSVSFLFRSLVYIENSDGSTKNKI